MWTLSHDPALQVPNDGPRRLPVRAALLSVAALLVPAAIVWLRPGWMSHENGPLLWIMPLLPGFLLAYYKGWRGAALALAAGMAGLAAAHAAFLLTGAEPPAWPWMLGVVVTYLLIACGIALLAELLHRERVDAEEQARTDHLTGLPNRREADLHVDRMFAAAVRGRPLAVVLFDVDHFKRFNDRHGHAAGDEVLRAFAGVLRRETRRMDLAARYGGEEFLTVLSPCALDDAVAYAERVRRALQDLELTWGRVTVSAGVAEFREGMGSPDFLIAAADHALYKAKESGRNRVEAFGRPAAALDPDPPAKGRAGEAKDTVRSVDRGRTAALIVLVDDDQSVEHSLTRSLSRMGHNVLDARNARHVLDLFAEFGDRIDLLITDVVMPDMNGLTLVSRIAELGYRVPVIYISGFLQGEVRLPGVDGTRAGFVEKPVGIDKLKREVERVLDQGE
ncbi:MAG: diguanylate cyclase [Gemmatimonadota bacterium]